MSSTTSAAECSADQGKEKETAGTTVPDGNQETTESRKIVEKSANHKNEKEQNKQEKSEEPHASNARPKDKVYEGNSMKFELHVLKNISIYIDRKKELKTIKGDLDRSIKDPSTITPFRRPGEGSKPIFQRPELERVINKPLDDDLDREKKHDSYRSRSKESSHSRKRRSRSWSSDRRHRDRYFSVDERKSDYRKSKIRRPGETRERRSRSRSSSKSGDRKRSNSRESSVESEKKRLVKSKETRHTDHHIMPEDNEYMSHEEMAMGPRMMHPMMMHPPYYRPQVMLPPAMFRPGPAFMPPFRPRFPRRFRPPKQP
ncbi:peptidyl-prolyl cis-trans isomerase G-like isoform X2 [Cimex lectularius]|uniref:Uncharacterized protein n=1 Tax=Cimex lectularius TaxID=79782 RepID=A0A8I6SFE4_CIMLE|nr:peptidyl-prolyl cis-trans isomerase G-like isoform X2 [Cimex lectularius]